MTKSGAFKLSILFFITFILCLPDFLPEVSNIQFLCVTFDPCARENDACGPSCATETINSSSSHRHDEGWYLCKTDTDLQLLLNDTSQSGEHVMVILAMKASNLSEWNISVFAFLNDTDLYTEPQNGQRLFSCYVQPDSSDCPHLNITLQENTPILKSTTSAKPFTSSLKTTTLEVTPSTDELKCRPTSNGFLFHYQELNVTAASATLPVAQTKRVWLALALTVVVVTVLSLGFFIIKSCRRHFINRRQLKRRRQKENLMRNVPEVSVSILNTSDDDVFTEISSIQNRTGDNQLNLDDNMYKRSLSPIFEITETSFNEEEINEDERCNASGKKEELKKSHQLQHPTAQSYCEPFTYLHHRSNYSSSGHEEDGKL